MFARPLSLLALATTAAAIFAAAAAAGGCCACATSCTPALVVVEPSYVTPIYIVDHGPVYSGPGIVTRPRIKAFNKPLADYPYVAQDYPSYDFYAAAPRHRR